jgi:gluconate 2-dehydrogenase gamma chain
MNPEATERDEEKSLWEHVKSSGIPRRKFLMLLAAGGAGAVLASCTSTTTLTSTLTNTATTTVTTTTTAPPSTTTTTVPTPISPDTFMFFSAPEAATLMAAFGRLIPGNAQDPGAIEAGAHIYIDRALLGYYQNLQQPYRRGLAALNAYSQSQYSAKFSDLSSSQQDSVLTDMQSGKARGFYAPGAAEFFGMMLKHVDEGTFCDPLYGGNRNLVGWKLIGYPGAQGAYGENNMQIGADQGTIIIRTLADLERTQMPLPDNGF